MVVLHIILAVTLVAANPVTFVGQNWSTVSIGAINKTFSLIEGSTMTVPCLVKFPPFYILKYSVARSRSGAWSWSWTQSRSWARPESISWSRSLTRSKSKSRLWDIVGVNHKG